MTNHEAKFLLRSRRPDGRDDADPVFADALAQAAKDPQLRGWLEQEQAFDAAFAGKLKSIQPPAGLREAILAGARASRPRRSWSTPLLWGLAAAASVAILVVFQLRSPAREKPDTTQFAAFALNDLTEEHSQHQGAHVAAMQDVQTQLADAALPLPSHLAVNLDDLRTKGCRTVTIAGREVFEFCFVRAGKGYHLYVGRAEDFSTGSGDARSMLMTNKAGFASTAWRDSQYVYSLVANAGPEALKQLL